MGGITDMRLLTKYNIHGVGFCQAFDVLESAPNYWLRRGMLFRD